MHKSVKNIVAESKIGGNYLSIMKSGMRVGSDEKNGNFCDA